MGYNVREWLVDSSKYSIKCPYTMKPQYVTIHETANDASAHNEISYMRNNNLQVSYHVAIDDKEAIIGIPFNRNAWHCGDANGIKSGNRTSIGIEICYSKSGGPKYNQAVENAANYAAKVLKQHGLNHTHLRQHYDWSKKNCPARIRANKYWETFKGKVQWYMEQLEKPKTPIIEKPQQQQMTFDQVPKKLYLPSTTDKWSIYPTNKAPIKANAIATLNPKKFGGLTYDVLGNPQKDVVTIKTSQFGIVNIYVAPSTGAIIK